MSRAFVGLVVFAGAWLMVDADGSSSEQQRLRSHFDSVLMELEGRDVRGLTAAQRLSRAQLIDWLAEYRNAGRFPVNDRYAEAPTPIFRDARGATCAMAYLVERSGRRDIVDRISAEQNLAYVRELTSDTSLVVWLDASGLSVAEAARVQPAYEEDEDDHTIPFIFATAGFSTISLFTAHANVFRPSELRGFAGILVGSATLMVAVLASLNDQVFLTGVNIGAGSVAVLSGIYAAFRPRDSAPPKPAETRKEAPAWLPLTEWSPKSGTRLGLSVRF